MSVQSEKQYSIEFFPPKTHSGKSKLDLAFDQLSKLNPHFCSVTYGANGATIKGTKELSLRYQLKAGNVAPHISFNNSSETKVAELLQDYKEVGIKRIVALRGDRSDGSTKQLPYASELVKFIRAQTGDQFHIDVACYPEIHPESESIETELRYFKNKIEAGANSAITQYFYNPDSYFYYIDYCNKNGITIPIVPGIMPINNYGNLCRFSSRCGAEIPRWLMYRLEQLNDDKQGLHEFGIEFVTQFCEKLLSGGAPGLHFYSMNLATAVKRIWENLKLSELK